MKTTKNINRFKVLAIIGGLLIGINAVEAQQKDMTALNKVLNSLPRSAYKHWSYADSLIARFNNDIYNTYYNYHFWKKGITHQFTILQVLIDKHGKVKRIWYSDSADKIFVNEF